MTLEVNQEEAISILKNIKILPMEREIKIKNEDDGKMVIRKYHINVENSRYSNMDIITIQYKVNKYTEKVKDYAVYLTNNFEDKVYLCKYSPKVLNTLFNNIILLELSNWRRIIQGLSPLRTINNYQSLMFELNIDSNKRINHLLYKLVEKNTSQLLNTFKEYQNSNAIIPVDIWQNQLV